MPIPCTVRRTADPWIESRSRRARIPAWRASREPTVNRMVASRAVSAAITLARKAISASRQLQPTRDDRSSEYPQHKTIEVLSIHNR